MNLPNKLTLTRIILIPVFIFFAASPYSALVYLLGAAGWSFLPPASYLVAGIVFAAASFTDYLDGHIARKRGLVTDFGKFADPLADKILTTVAFIYMMRDGVCAPLVLVVIVVREFAVNGVRMVAAGAPDGKVIAANMWGKVKTAMQMLTIIFYYLAMGIYHLLPQQALQSVAWPQVATYLLCWAVAVVTAVSGVQYIWQNRRFINTFK